jgi:hypothetical protein
MADTEAEVAEGSPLVRDLSDDERRQLTRRHYVRKGPDLVWREAGGEIRREPVGSLYYIRTDRGVFRVSRLDGRVVEV